MNQTVSTQQYISNTEIVRDPARIAGLLICVRDTHALINVSLPDTSETFSSVFLNIDIEKQLVTIDELIPLRGHALLTRSRIATIHTRLRGVNISFTIEMVGSGHSSGAAFYQFRLPVNLKYNLQRAFYRAELGANRHYPVLLGQNEQGLVLEGMLYDISAGGIGFKIPEKTATVLSISERFEHSQITLCTNKIIDCELEIRFIGEKAKARLRFIGARFINLHKTDEDAVARFVAELDREKRKKIASG
ncbi:MAG: hypothetical protein BMS9Abin36_0509 [Gammaproteobacteria bacterium]|nr:MAG: hypothetical protein BMS9Abin36_0509 [Gammaproteobacteria bacterium]